LKVSVPAFANPEILSSIFISAHECRIIPDSRLDFFPSEHLAIPRGKTTELEPTGSIGRDGLEKIPATAMFRIGNQWIGGIRHLPQVAVVFFRSLFESVPRFLHAAE
jgi:hypothetical protein